MASPSTAVTLLMTAHDPVSQRIGSLLLQTRALLALPQLAAPLSQPAAPVVQTTASLP